MRLLSQSLTLRTASTYLREDGHLQRLRELDVPDDAVAAVELPLPAGALAHAEAVDHDGVPPLEDLDVADAGVRDVRVHARRAVPGWACAGSACDRLWSVCGRPFAR